MNKEIKEILDKFDKVLENYELDKKFGQMSVDSICHLFPSELIAIKNHITKLQENYEIEKENNEILQQNISEIAKLLKIEEGSTIYDLYDGITNLQKKYDEIYNENCKLRENHNIDDISLLDENYELKQERDKYKKLLDYANDEVVSYCNTTLDLQKENTILKDKLNNMAQQFKIYDWENSNEEQLKNQIKSLYESIFKGDNDE